MTFKITLDFLFAHYFNSHAHVERDKERRRTEVNQNDFNSHAHVERDAFNLRRIQGQDRFQLTRSRGAWLVGCYGAHRRRHFNSHAHVERDIRLRWRQKAIKISTHTLTWSVTCWLSTMVMAFSIFQLTRSRGAWQWQTMPHRSPQTISTHTLTWSVTVYFIALAL